MDRVYLVTYENFDWWNIHCICSSLEKAENKKLELEKHIQNIKTHYYLEYNSEYDFDLKRIHSEDLIMEDEALWDEITNRVYMFQAKHRELNYMDINIEEKEVI